MRGACAGRDCSRAAARSRGWRLRATRQRLQAKRRSGWSRVAPGQAGSRAGSTPRRHAAHRPSAPSPSADLSKPVAALTSARTSERAETQRAPSSSPPHAPHDITSPHSSFNCDHCAITVRSLLSRNRRLGPRAPLCGPPRGRTVLSDSVDCTSQRGLSDRERWGRSAGRHQPQQGRVWRQWRRRGTPPWSFSRCRTRRTTRATALRFGTGRQDATPQCFRTRSSGPRRT